MSLPRERTKRKETDRRREAEVQASSSFTVPSGVGEGAKTNTECLKDHESFLQQESPRVKEVQCWVTIIFFISQLIFLSFSESLFTVFEGTR